MPCLCRSLPFPLRACKHSTITHVGETVCCKRRFEEHILRLLDTCGHTQQPFYTYIRRGCDAESQLLPAQSFLMLIPVCAASGDRARRLEEEASLTASLGTLNPPRAYSLVKNPSRRRASTIRGQRLFNSLRPLCRLRKQGGNSAGLSNHVSRARRNDWEFGLRKTASALCGHRFPGWQHAAKSAWNPSPGGWAFVAHHIHRTNEGVRRRWGLAHLRKIARRRRDLCFVISAISFAIPWLG